MTSFTSRRRFIEITPFAGMALLAACSPKPEPAAPVPMPTPVPTENTALLPMLDEKDAQAVALGYVAEASKTDTTKFKNYAVGNQCGNCALYLGKAGDAAGPCPLFTGKNVAAKGWCTSWVRKA